jgi:hypothetical protein
MAESYINTHWNASGLARAIQPESDFRYRVELPALTIYCDNRDMAVMVSDSINDTLSDLRSDGAKIYDVESDSQWHGKEQ